MATPMNAQEAIAAAINLKPMVIIVYLTAAKISPITWIKLKDRIWIKLIHGIGVSVT